MKKYRNPKPMPSPTPDKSDTVKIPTPQGKKRKPAPGIGVKRRDVSDEQLVPRRVKPTPSRRRFLDELNEMNKRSR